MGVLQAVSQKVLSATQGKSTAFFAAFFVSGNALAFTHNLTPTYIAFMGTLGGLVLGHSIKEDVVELKQQEQAKPDCPPDGDRH